MRSAAVFPDRAGRRADSLDPVSRGTFSWTWRWAWSRPRLGTTPIASGLQSLVRRVMTSASWLMFPAAGAGTMGGRAEELERTRPFGLLAAAFGCARSSPDQRRAAIAGLLAAPAAGDQGPITVTSDPGLRFRAVDAFTDLVEELALAGPLVIGLDDLQWADPSSLLTLGVLSRRLDYLPVGLIACFRPSHQTAEVDRLAGALRGCRRPASGPAPPYRGGGDRSGGGGGRCRAGPAAPGSGLGGGGQPAVRHRTARGAGPGGGDHDRGRAGGGGRDGAAADAAADHLAPA